MHDLLRSIVNVTTSKLVVVHKRNTRRRTTNEILHRYKALQQNHNAEYGRIAPYALLKGPQSCAINAAAQCKPTFRLFPNRLSRRCSPAKPHIRAKKEPFLLFCRMESIRVALPLQTTVRSQSFERRAL